MISLTARCCPSRRRRKSRNLPDLEDLEGTKEDLTLLPVSDSSRRRLAPSKIVILQTVCLLFILGSLLPSVSGCQHVTTLRSENTECSGQTSCKTTHSVTATPSEIRPHFCLRLVPSCGSYTCGCGLPLPGCLFSGTVAEPVTEEVFEDLTCPT